jgi:hypothetical protein
MTLAALLCMVRVWVLQLAAYNVLEAQPAYLN